MLYEAEQSRIDEMMMRMALREAETAMEMDEVPVGAIVVHGDRVIGRGHNQRERLQDPTAHAEMIALTAAAAELRSWRLEGCTLYVTLEPCAMCAGAIVLARIERLVFGTDDPKAGACGSVFNIVEDRRLNHQPQMTTGILKQECGDLLRHFFARQRSLGKK